MEFKKKKNVTRENKRDPKRLLMFLVLTRKYSACVHKQAQGQGSSTYDAFFASFLHFIYLFKENFYHF